MSDDVNSVEHVTDSWCSLNTREFVINAGCKMVERIAVVHATRSEERIPLPTMQMNSVRIGSASAGDRFAN